MPYFWPFLPPLIHRLVALSHEKSPNFRAFFAAVKILLAVLLNAFGNFSATCKKSELDHRWSRKARLHDCGPIRRILISSVNTAKKYASEKYASRATKWLAAFSLICSVLLFIGIVLVYSKKSNVSIHIALFASGKLLGVLSVFLQKKAENW